MTSLPLSRTIFAGVSLIFQSFFTLNSIILLLIIDEFEGMFALH